MLLLREVMEEGVFLYAGRVERRKRERERREGSSERRGINLSGGQGTRGVGV